MNELIGLIDLIEFELLFAGGRSARTRLSDAVIAIGGSGDPVRQDALSLLLNVDERLEKIERILVDNGFETGSRLRPASGREASGA